MFWNFKIPEPKNKVFEVAIHVVSNTTIKGYIPSLTIDSMVDLTHNLFFDYQISGSNFSAEMKLPLINSHFANLDYVRNGNLEKEVCEDAEGNVYLKLLDVKMEDIQKPITIKFGATVKPFDKEDSIFEKYSEIKGSLVKAKIEGIERLVAEIKDQGIMPEHIAEYIKRNVELPDCEWYAKLSASVLDKLDMKTCVLSGYLEGLGRGEMYQISGLRENLENVNGHRWTMARHDGKYEIIDPAVLPEGSQRLVVTANKPRGVEVHAEVQGPNSQVKMDIHLYTNVEW
jgi:hypothetical protein